MHIHLLINVLCVLPQCMLGTRTFLYMCCLFLCSIRPWTLTQCPVCELTISPGSDSWEQTYRCLPRRAAAPFPRAVFPTVEPCVASTSPEYRHSCSYLTLSSQTCVRFSLPLCVRLHSFSLKTGLFICGTFAPLLCLCFPSSLLSARVLVGYKPQHSGVKTSLYSKHLATFPYPETWVIIQHLISLCILKYPSQRPTTAYKS